MTWSRRSRSDPIRWYIRQKIWLYRTDWLGPTPRLGNQRRAGSDTRRLGNLHRSGSTIRFGIQLGSGVHICHLSKLNCTSMPDFEFQVQAAPPSLLLTISSSVSIPRLVSAGFGSSSLYWPCSIDSVPYTMHAQPTPFCLVPHLVLQAVIKRTHAIIWHLK